MKVLAVSHNVGDPTPWITQEGARMAELVASGFVEHVWLKADYSGAVVIAESADPATAAEVLATLPLVRNNLTSFTVTPLLEPPVG